MASIKPIRKLVSPEKVTSIKELNKIIKDIESKFVNLEPWGQLRLLKALGVGKDYFTCQMCGEVKKKGDFYYSTNPIMKTGLTNICRECGDSIAQPVVNGEKTTVTKETLDDALYYLDKPFINSVWESSQNEFYAKNGQSIKSVYSIYMKTISMKQYYTYTYRHSDGYMGRDPNSYLSPTIGNYAKENNIKSKNESKTEQEIVQQFEKNKNDTLKLLGYLPFEKENLADQPFLYSQLIGFLDSSEEGNDDMMRVQSIISIVRGFLQMKTNDDMIANLSRDIKQAEKNVPTIRALQSMKKDAMTSITKLAEQSCISLKNSKNSIKGENTWTGKIRKLKEMGLREAEINGFDMETCKGMSQVMDLSNRSILKELRFDESEWSNMVADQREMITKLQYELDSYKEIARILLRENLDLKDYAKSQYLDLTDNLVDLDELYSPFSFDIEDTTDEEYIEDDYDEIEYREEDNENDEYEYDYDDLEQEEEDDSIESE